MTAKEIKQRLDRGDTLLLVDTGVSIGYQNHFRFLSDGKTANVKGLSALKRRGYKLPYIRVPRHIAIMQDEWNSYALEDIRYWYEETHNKKIVKKPF